MREILFKAKRLDNGKWVCGYYQQKHCISGEKRHFIFWSNTYTVWENVAIDHNTLCQYTGLTDKNGKKIWENDITKLVLEDGEVRYFKVSFKKVIRKVKCHPSFYDDFAKVELNAVCFEWKGFELFPCVDENGVSDVQDMEVIGNIFDNPELLEKED